MSEEVDNFLAHVGKKGMKWGQRKAQYTNYANKSATQSINKYGGSKGKAAAVEIGKGIGLSLVANAATMVVANIAPAQMRPGIIAVDALFQVGNTVNTVYKTAKITNN